MITKTKLELECVYWSVGYNTAGEHVPVRSLCIELLPKDRAVILNGKHRIVVPQEDYWFTNKIDCLRFINQNRVKKLLAA